MSQVCPNCGELLPKPDYHGGFMAVVQCEHCGHHILVTTIYMNKETGKWLYKDEYERLQAGIKDALHATES